MPQTVSAIIPAYNARTTIARAVQSCLDQTHKPIEVIVADDGSTDDTADIVAAFPPPVRLVRKQNGGPASARNAAARLATGEWLGLLDSDDWWLPHKLETQLRMATSPDIGVIHALSHRRRNVPQELTFDIEWQYNWVGASSVIMPRAAFEAVGCFDEAIELFSVEDYNLWLRFLAAGYRIVLCDEILIGYTHDVGISTNLPRSLAASLYNIDSLEARLNLPAALARKKRAATLSDFGLRFRNRRELPLARDALWRALRADPAPARLAHWAIACLPRPLLDLKRRATGQGADAAAQRSG